MNTPNKKIRWFLRLEFFYDLIKIFIIAAVLVTGIRLFIAEPFVVSGDSMIPTFYPNDYVVINELSYELHKPQHGDVIVFHYPLDPSIYFIKRLIGVPGDTVVVNNGSVYVTSGKKVTRLLTEPYVEAGQVKIETGTTTLGTDEYFVLGDNRNASFDSRVWGPVPGRYILGKVVARLYPFTQAEIYKTPTEATSTLVTSR